MTEEPFPIPRPDPPRRRGWLGKAAVVGLAALVGGFALGRATAAPCIEEVVTTPAPIVETYTPPVPEKGYWLVAAPVAQSNQPRHLPPPVEPVPETPYVAKTPVQEREPRCLDITVMLGESYGEKAPLVETSAAPVEKAPVVPDLIEQVIEKPVFEEMKTTEERTPFGARNTDDTKRNPSRNNNDSNSAALGNNNTPKSEAATFPRKEFSLGYRQTGFSNLVTTDDHRFVKGIGYEDWTGEGINFNLRGLYDDGFFDFDMGLSDISVPASTLYGFQLGPNSGSVGYANVEGFKLFGDAKWGRPLLYGNLGVIDTDVEFGPDFTSNTATVGAGYGWGKPSGTFFSLQGDYTKNRTDFGVQQENTTGVGGTARLLRTFTWGDEATGGLHGFFTHTDYEGDDFRDRTEVLGIDVRKDVGWRLFGVNIEPYIGARWVDETIDPSRILAPYLRDVARESPGQWMFEFGFTPKVHK